MSDRLLVRAGTLLERAGARPRRDTGVLIADGTVQRVGPVDDLRPDATREIDCPGLVLPGLVDAHSHLRGTTLADHGIPHRVLEPWICSLAVMSATPPQDEAYLAAARLLDTGVTAVQAIAHTYGGRADLEAAGHAMRDGVRRAGIRALISLGWTDRAERAPIPADGAWATVPQPQHDPQALADLPDLLRDWLAAADDLVRHAVGPVAAQWAGDQALAAFASAAQGGARVHTHLQESRAQRTWVAGESAPVRRLDAAGLLGPATSLAHGVDLDPDELALLAERGATLVHCPASNRRLQVGRAAPVDWLAAGITAALGLDSGTDDDGAVDFFAVMREALITSRELAALRGGQVLTAVEVLTMATAGGATALGLAGGGRIEPGAPADLIELDLGADRDADATTGAEDVAAAVIDRGTPSRVRTVLVAGTVLRRRSRNEISAEAGGDAGARVRGEGEAADERDGEASDKADLEIGDEVRGEVDDRGGDERADEDSAALELRAVAERVARCLHADSAARAARAVEFAPVIAAAEAAVGTLPIDRLTAHLFASGSAVLGESPRRLERPGMVWVDLPAGRLLTRGSDGTAMRLWTSGTPTLGALVPLAGRGGVAALAHDRVIILDETWNPRDTVLLDEIPDGHRLSDACAGPDGAIWAGTVPEAGVPDGSDRTGRLLRITPDQVTVVLDGLGFANGIGFLRDGDLLLVDSATGELLRARPEGSRLAAPRQVHQFDTAPGTAPDGLAIDELDRPWVAIFGAGRVERLDLGEPGIGPLTTPTRVGAVVRVPARRTTACAFDGVGGLVVTSGTAEADELELAAYPGSGGVFRAETGLRGGRIWKGIGWC